MMGVKPPGVGVLREFLVGVSRWQNDKPTLVYEKWNENHTLIYGIFCEIRPMDIVNKQNKYCLEVQFIRFYGFGNDNSHILVHVERNLCVISSLLHSSTKKIPLATDFR